jgi:hypothetical protein
MLAAQGHGRTWPQCGHTCAFIAAARAAEAYSHRHVLWYRTPSFVRIVHPCFDGRIEDSQLDGNDPIAQAIGQHLECATF